MNTTSSYWLAAFLLAAGIALLLMGLVATAVVAAETAPLNDENSAYDRQTRVNICHFSQDDGYHIPNSPNVNSILGPSGHDSHEQDIIPSFYWNFDEETGLYPGKNWDTDNEIFWNDGGCNGVTDVCPNIDEIQEELPEGFEFDNEGNCVEPTLPEPDQAVKPILECVAPIGDGAYRAHFGYENLNTTDVEIPIGNGNKFTGGGSSDLDRGQPTLFEYPAPNHPEGREGRTGFFPDNAFYVDFDGTNLVWTLTGPDGNTRTSTANSGSKACPEVPEPQLCTVTVVSDETTTVEEKDGAFAKALSFIHTHWTAVISGATWIWGDNPVENPTIEETQTFVSTFGWSGNVEEATLYVASDNTHEAILNGTVAGTASEPNNFSLATQDEYDVTSLIAQGDNELKISVTNIPQNTDYKSNPAGVLYRLDVSTYDEGDCNPPYIGDDEPAIENITLCKRDAKDEPVPGWGMTLSNGETAYDLTTEEDDGCVTQEVDPTDGPWTATETGREGWSLDEIIVEGGKLMEDTLGCVFFDDDGESSDTYTCTFVNEEEGEDGPYDDCLTQNLLINGSFEDDVVTNTALWQKFASVIGWTVHIRGSDTTTTLELHRGWSGNEAADGLQYAELDGNQSVRVSQDVLVEEGAGYRLFWAFAPRQNTTAEQNELSVEIDGTEVATEGPIAGIGVLSIEDWIHGSYDFTAEDETVEIAFADAGPSNTYGTFLDSAYFCKIAEPVDVCGNLDGIQLTLPEGHEFKGENICEPVGGGALALGAAASVGGGSCANCGSSGNQPAGEVQGEQDNKNDGSGDNNGSSDGDESDNGGGSPQGEVGGVSAVPSGAPNAGAGGMAQMSYLAMLFVLLSGLIASLSLMRFGAVNA